MVINSFEISQDKSNLVLTLSDAVAVTTVKLWTQTTYKTDGLEIDLSDRLDGTTDQVINIPYADISIANFDGVYFIEIGDGTTTICKIAAELTRYKECILDKVLAYTDCYSCLTVEQPQILNAQTILYSIEKAIELNLIQEVLIMIFFLDKICSNDCKGCGEYKNI